MIISSVLFLSLLSIETYARPDKITIINNFNRILSFHILLNADVLPDLFRHFNLRVGEETLSRVRNTGKKAFVRVEDNQNHSAIWRVEFENNQVKFFTLSTNGINIITENQTIKFTQPI
jgi:hypothetical protein